MNLSVSAGKLFVVLGMVAFVFLVLVGIPSLGMMMAHADATTSQCPFTPGQLGCVMTPLDHSAVFQRFVAIPLNSLYLSLYLCVFLLIGSLFKDKDASLFLRLSSARKPVWTTNYVSRPLFLEEAFSSGIVHTKVF